MDSIRSYIWRSWQPRAVSFVTSILFQIKVGKWEEWTFGGMMPATGGQSRAEDCQECPCQAVSIRGISIVEDEREREIYIFQPHHRADSMIALKPKVSSKPVLNNLSTVKHNIQCTSHKLGNIVCIDKKEGAWVEWSMIRRSWCKIFQLDKFQRGHGGGGRNMGGKGEDSKDTVPQERT